MPLKERKSLQQLCLQIQQRNGGVTTTGGLVATWCVTQKVGDTDQMTRFDDQCIIKSDIEVVVKPAMSSFFQTRHFSAGKSGPLLLMNLRATQSTITTH